jgi:UDP-N-acetylmuramate--alanine ligase
MSFGQERFHFIGIGGIGMSGLALILKEQGHDVSGCDPGTSAQKALLKQKGCTIYDEHCPSHMARPFDAVVYSSAIAPSHPELLAAAAKGMRLMKRGEFLGELLEPYTSIGITGTHGKTTTTSLVSHLFSNTKHDPTVVCGGIVKNLGTHARLGLGSVAIAEADESDRSLLFQSPTYVIVTNIEADHLDIYKDLDDIKATLLAYINKVPAHGKAYLCIDDENIRQLLGQVSAPYATYGFAPDAQFSAHDVVLGHSSSTFKVNGAALTIGIPGRHNVQNAIAAYALAHDFGFDDAHINHRLSTFQGAARRFDFKGTFNGADIFDDYGHHPTEIVCTLATARSRARGRLVTVFQPHRYTRTKALWNEFIESFEKNMPDILYIAEVYSAGEEALAGVNSENLVSALASRYPNATIRYVKTLDDAINGLKGILREDDLLITIGAGNITYVAQVLGSVE